MRNTLIMASLVLLAGNTSHCNLSGPVDHFNGDFSHSVSTLLCGPADGPATAILLSRDPIADLNPSYPNVHVRIWEPVSQLKSVYMIGGLSGDVSAQYFVNVSEFVTATSGTVRIDRVGPNNRIEGRVDLRFPAPVGTVTEAFDAPWIESFILCG